MADYIEREALLKRVESRKLIFEENTPVEEVVAEQLSVFREEIEATPAADVVEVVHARWIAPLFGHFDTPVTCSQCNTLHRIPTCFCSACGAKMDGEGREQ